MKVPKLISLAAAVALMVASFLLGRMTAGRERAAEVPALAAEIQHPAHANSPAQVEFVASEHERRVPEAVVKPAEPPPPAVRDLHPEENDQQRGFRREHESLSINALERKKRERTAQLDQLAGPEYAECLRRGEYEVVGKGASYTPENWDNERMTQIRSEGGGGQVLAI